MTRDTAAHIGEKLRGDRGGGSVGAVDDDVAVVEREPGHGGEQRANIVGAVALIDGGHVQRGEGELVGRGFEVGEDALLEVELGRVGQLVAVRAEELDAVVLPGIVRGGDDDAGREAVRGGEVSDGGRGDDACVFDRGAALGEAGGEGGGDLVRGLAGVHAEQQARVAAKGLRKRKADGMNGGGVERGLASDGANAVGAEKLLHGFQYRRGWISQQRRWAFEV